MFLEQRKPGFDFMLTLICLALRPTGGSARAIFGFNAQLLATQQQQQHQPEAGSHSAVGNVEEGITTGDRAVQASQGSERSSGTSSMSQQSQEVLRAATEKLGAWHTVVTEVLNTVRAADLNQVSMGNRPGSSLLCMCLRLVHV